MKRAFLLVLAAVLLLLLLTTTSTNTKVTPSHTTWTDVVETQGEISRALNLLVSAKSKRKEVTTTPTLPPSPTPEAAPPLETTESPEEVEAAGEIAPQADVEPQGETKPQRETETPIETVPPGETLITAAGVLPESQIFEGAWITHFDCLTEGHCGSRTASGIYLEKGGRYAACDINYWPFGTKMTVVGDPNGYVWTCVDVGAAIVGPDHWDVWFYNPVDGWKYLQQIGGEKATIVVFPQ